jgi:2-methylcitrate dehydratase PrpD
MGIQYSVPFMTAAACLVDVTDPSSVNENLIDNGAVTALVNKIRLVEIEEGSKESWDAKIEITFKDRREPIVGSQIGFPGSPVSPFALADLRQKFMRIGILGCGGEQDLLGLFSRLSAVEELAIVRL